MSKFNRKNEETESKSIPLVYSAVLAHGYTGQLPEGPVSIGATCFYLYMLCMCETYY